MDYFIDPKTSVQFLATAFLAILFLQSGWDKILDWKGNLDWLKGHFANSLLSGLVPVLLGTITLFEMMAGVVSAVGAVFILVTGSTELALLGAQISALSILMLFFGQRMAKDYEGAATLASYFLLTLFTIFLMI